jgi:hypothetical protein
LLFYAGHSARIGISGHKKEVYHASGKKANSLMQKIKFPKD